MTKQDLIVLSAEFISTAIALIVVSLHTQEKKLGWCLNIFKKLFSLVVFYNKQLYVKCLVDTILLFNSYYGWSRWSIKKNKKPYKIQYLSTEHFLGILIVCTLIGMILGYLLTLYTSASMPYWDVTHATLIIATYTLLARKKIQAWIIWILANLIYLPVCWHKATYLFLLKYLLYTSMACYGYYKWHKQVQKQLIEN